MAKQKKSLGTQGISTDGVTCGVSYVVIPPDVDRGIFITQCLLTATVMIADESGGVERDVPITKQALRDTVFPKDSNGIGSQVFWNMLPKHSQPIVTGVLYKNDEIPDNTEEGEYRIIRGKDGSVAQINLNKDGIITVSAYGKKDNAGKLKISVVNPNKTALLEVYVKGDVSIKADKQVSFLNAKKAEMRLTEDKFYSGNAEKSYKTATLAEPLREILKNLITAIKAITVPTTNGPSGIPNNGLVFEQISQQLENFYAKYNKIN